MAEHETACQLPFPEPPASAQIKTALWPAGKPIERIHSTRLAGTLFNPGYGSARFSPLTPVPGVTIPTLYGAESIDVALMETLLHDLPLRCAGLGVELSKLQALTHSQLIAREDLALLDVNPRTLKKLGITQYQLLGSRPEDWPDTRRWAAQFYRDNPTAQGLRWASKQHGDKALMLFGDRITPGSLQLNFSTPAASSPALYLALERLADEMALALIPDIL